MSRRRRVRRAAYTLLEVMLVLLITAVLVAAVAAAINIHLRTVDAGRAEVEQAQLARALLRRIAADLRAAVPIVVDSSSDSSAQSSAAGAAQSAMSNSGGGGSGSGSGGSSSNSGGGSSSGVTNITGSTGVTNITGSTGVTEAGGTSGSSGSSGGGSTRSGSGGGSSSLPSGMSGGSSSGGAGTGSSSSSSGAEESTEATESTISPLGVYGSQYGLQIDVSQLPRTDRIDSLTGTIAPTTPGAVADPPSDVKTVSYYISTNNYSSAAEASGGLSVSVQTSGGLVRSQIDRSIVNYGATYGGAVAGTNEQILAPEATAIEFRYFDGTEWLTEWDSSQRQAVPVAVEILLTLRAPEAADSATSSLALDVPAEKQYRLLVHLPAGEASSLGATSTESTSEGAASEEASP